MDAIALAAAVDPYSTAPATSSASAPEPVPVPAQPEPAPSSSPAPAVALAPASTTTAPGSNMSRFKSVCSFTSQHIAILTRGIAPGAATATDIKPSEHCSGGARCTKACCRPGGQACSSYTNERHCLYFFVGECQCRSSVAAIGRARLVHRCRSVCI